jgi:hypothetical protein
VLLNDVDEEPAAVIGAPKARVIARWLVVVALVVLLFGLVGWSYATSSELSSGIQVERTYQPTLKNIQEWEDDNNTFTCEGAAVDDNSHVPALCAMHVLSGPPSRATIAGCTRAVLCIAAQSTVLGMPSCQHAASHISRQLSCSLRMLFSDAEGSAAACSCSAELTPLEARCSACTTSVSAMQHVCFGNNRIAKTLRLHILMLLGSEANTLEVYSLQQQLAGKPPDHRKAALVLAAAAYLPALHSCCCCYKAGYVSPLVIHVGCRCRSMHQHA